MLINLLIYNKDDEIQYICYLLYDLITANSVDSSDSSDHNFIYESLPWKIKLYFKDVVKHTIKYTSDMMQKYDINKVTLEQQIYLLKANENVKEKAMAKLKEIKGKPDELSTKAKQYLEKNKEHQSLLNKQVCECSCGKTYTYSNKFMHNKSKYHLNNKKE